MRANLSSNDDHICIDIGVCTYRRPELEKALRSLAMLDVPANVTLRIIVADNDSAPSAAAAVDGLRAVLPYEITYVHCPSSNISIARNACLDNAKGDFLAFIDDDEAASPGWIENLLRTAQATAADAVLGPVKATYRPDAPRWMKRGDFHSTFPVWVAGEIITGYTCNVLLRLHTPSLAGRRFNLALGRSGGEDTEFFTHMQKAGGKIAYAAEAWVEEPVPPGRATFSWLAKRKFRFGQTHGRLLGNHATARRRAMQLGLAMAKSGYCALAALLFLFLPVRRNSYALRACLHVGASVGLLGVREIEQYGAVEVRSS